MILLRPAKPTDSHDLLAWRNDEITRAYSRHSEPVSSEEHDRWFKFNVEMGYPTHIVMMGCNDLGNVGVVRFDADKGDVMSYTVSITVAPRHRRKGLGLEMLAQACWQMGDNTLNADIRRDNEASIKMFERCGFYMLHDDGEFFLMRKEPVR